MIDILIKSMLSCAAWDKMTQMNTYLGRNTIEDSKTYTISESSWTRLSIASFKLCSLPQLPKISFERTQPWPRNWSPRTRLVLPTRIKDRNLKLQEKVKPWSFLFQEKMQYLEVVAKLVPSKHSFGLSVRIPAR